MTVEVFTLATHTHGVDAEAHLLEGFLRVKVFSSLIVGHEFFFAQLIEILHRREVCAFLLGIVGCIRDTEPRIQLG